MPYNAQMVTEAIVKALDGAPRGAKSRLAEAVGVSPATVTKWLQGHVRPEPDRWPAIEQALGMAEGDLRVAAGLPRHVTILTSIGMYPDSEGRISPDPIELGSDLTDELVALYGPEAVATILTSMQEALAAAVESGTEQHRAIVGGESSPGRAAGRESEGR